MNNPGISNNGGNAINAKLPTIVPAWTHREFAFTLQNDAYLRYLSFNDADELKRQVLKLVPQRFEVGAIYNAKVPCIHPKNYLSISLFIFRSRATRNPSHQANFSQPEESWYSIST